MVVSASGTILSEYTATQRIKAIIEGDERIKGEIDARIRALLEASKKFTFLFLPVPYRSRLLKKPYTPNELKAETEKSAREKAVYAQYIEDSVFASKVNSALA